MTTLAACPRCAEKEIAESVVYGIHVRRCSRLSCGAILTGKTADEAEAKWNARDPKALASHCPHDGGIMRPFKLNLTGKWETNGYQCSTCGCSTGGRTVEQAWKIQTLRQKP